MGVSPSKNSPHLSEDPWIQLNEDLISEILNRLPIKTLCQITCVCKSWYSLISSSLFIRNHLNQNPNDKPYLVFSPLNTTSSWFYAFFNPRDFSPLRFRSTPFHPPREKKSVFTSHVIGVIHGVVCLSREGPFNSIDFTLLWNPIIHKYLDIIPASAPFLDSRDVGFGFDSTKNDFKVVRFSQPSEPLDKVMRLNESSFDVFSTYEGQWRNVVVPDHTRNCGFVSRYGCFTNGTIHWLISRNHDIVLLMFDCERDELRTMELPRINWARLFTYCGRLFMGTKRRPKEEVWVMEDDAFEPYSEDFADIKEMWMGIRGRVGSRLQLKIHCYDFEPSMFLMDVKSLQVQSYAVKTGREGNFYYLLKDGRLCHPYIPVP